MGGLLDTHYSVMDRDVYPSSYHENSLKTKKSSKRQRDLGLMNCDEISKTVSQVRPAPRLH